MLGVHEFCSPTYYGTDLNGLLMIQSYAHHERQQRQADALLHLFWTDIAANWFPAARRLGGSHSRSYDYLRGLGALDWHLWVHGWLDADSPSGAERAEPWSDQWRVPPQLAEMARHQLPRLVRQHWGFLPAEGRTQMIYPDVALSCCGAAYGNQDSTLVVDLAPGKGTVPFLLGQKSGQSPRELPRCFFIPDGRDDPYGKAKYATGAAGHLKALHMQPFWAGAQRSCDALGLVIYRGADVANAKVTRVQSHFRLPAGGPTPFGSTASGCPRRQARWTNQTKFRFRQMPAWCCVMAARRSDCACRGRSRWTGEPRPPRLVDDGNPWNCLRLTVDHGRPGARSTGFSRNDSQHAIPTP